MKDQVFESIEDFTHWLDSFSIEDMMEQELNIGESFPSNIQIRLVGEKFDSSLTSTVMESILELQKAINNIYKDEINTTRLSREDRDKIELVIIVDRGSSFVNIDMQNAVEVLKTMNGTEITIALGLIVAGYVGVKWVKEHYNTKREEIKQKIESEQSKERREMLDRTLITVDNAVNGIQKAYRKLSKTHTSEIELNGQSVTSSELADLTKTPRQKREVYEQVLEGLFKVKRLDFSDPEEIYMDVVHISSSNELKNVALQQSIIHEDDFKILEDSAEREPVEMRLIVKYRGESVDEARFDSLRPSTN